MQVVYPNTPPMPIHTPIVSQFVVPEMTHLHVHTYFSIRDGAIKIKDLATKCRENGMTACAMTDHGNIYASIKFYKEMTKQGIKPIIGYEAYIQDIDISDIPNPRDYNRHLILLAMNNNGYRSLMYIASDASLTGGQKSGTRFAKAIANLDYIKQNNLGKDIICLTGCIAGQIPSFFLRNRHKDAYEYLYRLKSVFNEVYLEVQINDIPEQAYVNSELLTMANTTNTKLVYTKDAHYLNKDHYEAHDALLALQINKQIDDPNRWRFDGDGYYITTPIETYEIVTQAGLPIECITNSSEIANKCNIDLIGNENSYYHGSLFPDYPDIPIGYTQSSYLFKLANDGLLNFIQNNWFSARINITEYVDRLNYELDVIIEKGYAGYFLILWDLLKYCADNKIGYSARGSGVGSLVCKVLGITKQDPIRYNLLFERFLSQERNSAPDIDLDISDTERGRVIEYMQQKYGANRVAQIITFSQLTIKSAAKELARLSENRLGGKTNSDEAQKMFSKVIPAKMPDQTTPTYELLHDIALNPSKYQDKYGIELAHYVEISKVFNNAFNQYPDIAQIASQLEGLYNNTGNHAAGVVLFPDDSRNYTPLDRAAGAALLPIAGYDMKDIDELGLLKIDVLGLSTMRVLHNSAKLANINIDEIPRDDQDVFRMLQDGYTTDVFQLSGDGMTRACMDSRVNSIDDITCLVALFRPGPLDGINEDTGKTIYQQYIDCCQSGTHFNIHPRLFHIVADAKGNMIYQEHIMRIVMEMTGCSLGVSDVIRRLIGKKKINEMRLYRNVFKYGEREEIVNPDGSKTYNPQGAYKLNKDGTPMMFGAIYNGFTEHETDNIWNQIVRFAGYSFNKSHATAYADTAYQTAYMKLRYPEFYMAEAMTAHKLQEDLIASIKEAKRLGVKVLQPDINLSDTEFTLEPSYMDSDGRQRYAIRFGFGKIKGISNADVIINERNTNGKFKDINNYFSRISHQQWNKNKTEALIRVGCFDSLLWDANDLSRGYCQNRLELLNYYYDTIRNFNEITKSAWLNADSKGKQGKYYKYNPVEYTKTSIRFDFEYELLGMCVSGHPLEGLPYVPWNNVNHRQVAAAYGIVDKFNIVKDKNGQNYARFMLETLCDIRECIMWSNEYTQFSKGGVKRLPKGTIIEATGKKDISRGGLGQFIVNKIQIHLNASSIYVSKSNIPKKHLNDGYTPVYDSNAVIEDDE